MKYAIKIWGSSELPHYVSGITTYKAQGFRKASSMQGTLVLSEAILYDDIEAAKCIARIVKEKYKNAEVVAVTEKQIFAAKLANR